MARIAVDMDEVLADHLSEHISRYNSLFQGSVGRDSLNGQWLRDVVPREHQRATDALVHCEDFFEDLQVVEGAREVLERLSRNHEIFIATAAMEVPSSMMPKFRWLLRHFPFVSPMNFVFCGTKGIVSADYLIDDNPKHFPFFVGEGILFDAPHNRQVTGYRRVHSWFEVEDLFAKASDGYLKPYDALIHA